MVKGRGGCGWLRVLMVKGGSGVDAWLKVPSGQVGSA
jgi:hypothetical protein